MAFDAAAFDYLLRSATPGRAPLLACYPRDLLRQVRDLARYEGTAPRLDAPALDWAWNNYFAGGEPAPAAEPWPCANGANRDQPIGEDTMRNTRV